MTHSHRGHPCTLISPHEHYPVWLRRNEFIAGWLAWEFAHPGRSARPYPEVGH
jgi:hypothetical protein